MYTIYAIYNASHDKIYIGQTEDVNSRLDVHNNHVLKGFTSRYSGTWVLIYSEIAQTRKLALVREKQLKSFRGREFIRRHIPG